MPCWFSCSLAGFSVGWKKLVFRLCCCLYSLWGLFITWPQEHPLHQVNISILFNGFIFIVLFPIAMSSIYPPNFFLLSESKPCDFAIRYTSSVTTFRTFHTNCCCLSTPVQLSWFWSSILFSQTGFFFLFLLYF